MKGKKGVLIILGVLLTSIIMGISINRLFKVDYEKLSKLDQQMLSDLSEVYETYEKNGDKLWNDGFTFSEIPLVLTPAKKEKGIFHLYSYVIGVDGLSTSPFAKQIKTPKELDLPPVYRVPSFHPTYLKTWLPANFLFTKVKNKQTTFFHYSPDNFTKEGRVFKYFLIHEVFHEYEQVPKWKNIDTLESSIYVEKREQQQYQQLLQEFSLLDLAYQKRESKELLPIMVDYVTLRQSRYQEFPYMKEEKKVETLEGIPQFVEYQYAALHNEPLKPIFTIKGDTYSFKDVFNTNVLNDFDSYLASFLDKDLYYFVGSLEATLMTNLEIEWQEEVKNGTLLFDILQKELENEPTKSIDDIKTTYQLGDYQAETDVIMRKLNVKKE